MSDMLNIGRSALLSYQTALSTVSHNIANANTEGYTRERTNLAPLPAQQTSAGPVGSGVYVSSVSRVSDSFLKGQLLNDSSASGRISEFQQFTSQVDGWLSDANTGLATPLQGFFDAMNGVSANPTSPAARQALLQKTQQLTSSLNGMQSQFDGLDTEVLSSMSSTVNEINNYTSQIAKLNVQILQLQSQAATGQAPNDLLDQRDQLLQNLAGDIGITTTTETNGSIDVFTASGQPLVLNAVANSLSLTTDTYGNNGNIVLNSGGGQKSDITAWVSGGKLGGLMDFRREVLNPAIDQIGRMSVALADAINTQQQAGMDLYGQLGGPLFTTPNVPVAGSSANTGGASVAATVSDPNQLGTGDYVLALTAGGWTLTDQATGTQVPLAGAGTVASPLTGAGLQIVLSGAAANVGDKFLLQPTRYAAGQIDTIISDPAKIAAALPVQTSPSRANTGTEAISNLQIVDPTDPNLLTTVQIQFPTATTYTINGGAPQAYTSGGTISVNGWSLQISGTPGINDTFTVKANVAGSSDNGNALIMAGIASQNIIGNSTETLAGANSALVSGVGAQAQQATAQLNAQTALTNQDTAARNSISGVNLDEEAAALTQFQQAYQASAQVISVANSLFQTLMAAIQH
jgi:flagellar hook-associated protein 1 FlgK